MKIWLTSDTHFNHSKLIGYGRPVDFGQRILSGLERIKDDDILIHLGDFCIGHDEEVHKAFMSKLPLTRKILVLGNHDHKSAHWYLTHGWDMVVDSFQMKRAGKNIWFSHKPLYEKREEVDLNIHGHLHGTDDRYMDERHGPYDKKYYYDVAPDTHAYLPITLDSILL